MTKAMKLLRSLDRNKIIRHKKEPDFYIEVSDWAENCFDIWREEKVNVVNIKTAERIIIHHGTKMWEICESSYIKRHPVASML